MALTVSILTKSTPEQAFEKLSKDYNPEIRYVNKNITDEDFEDAISMQKFGMSWREVGEAFGMKTTTMFNRVKRYKQRRDKANG